MKYKKTLAELEKVAVKWWPKALAAEVAKLSVIPKLLETQEQFISILKLAGDSPEQIFKVIQAGSLPPNLFLKHLVVVTDYGGELIKRLGSEFTKIFVPERKGKKPQLTFSFKGQVRHYTFQALPCKGLSNSKLGIDGEAVVSPRELNGLMQDVIMLLLHGGSSTVSNIASLERCDLGGLLGDPVQIDKYVRQ